MHRMIAMVEDDTRRSFESGGSESLKAQLKKLDTYLPGEHLLTDDAGPRSGLGRRPIWPVDGARIQRRTTPPGGRTADPGPASTHAGRGDIA